MTKQPPTSSYQASGRPRAAVVIGLAFLIVPPGCRDSGSTSKNSAASNANAQVSRQTSDSPAENLEQAIKARDWAQAYQVAPQALIEKPNDPHVLTNAAVASANAGRRVEAAQLLVDAAEATKFAPGNRIDHAVGALLDVGRVYDAISLLEEVVKHHPSASAYRRMLVGFLGEVELTEAIGEHIRRLIQDRTFDLPLLLATTETSSRRFSQKTIDTLMEKNPDDRRPRLGQAKSLLGSRDAGGAESVLRNILDHHPEFTPAHAMLGVALITQGKVDEVPRWYSNLPADAADYAGYWVTIGQWAVATNQTAVAVRAFAEATRRSPNDSGIWARLGGAMRRWKAEQDAKGVDPPPSFDLAEVTAGIDRRNTDLLELRDRFATFRSGDLQNQRMACEISKELLDLGRIWEAEAWLAVAAQLPAERSGDLAALREEAIRQLRLDRDWQSRREHPELAFDVKQFPLPSELTNGQLGSIESHSRSGRQSQLPAAPAALPIRLAEEAVRRGLTFYGEVGSGVQGPRVPIYQTLGCGGGVIDFDHDGQHDLVFVAAGGAPRQTDSEPGVLFRNHGSEFRDVSMQSGFGDRGFSHGVVVGDYNDDGFPDIAVLNLGRNRLFRNNGDGTFSDASDRLGETGKGEWSTSGAFVDVDRDGYSDLVIVNYCDANQPLDEPCFSNHGQQINCYPLRYRAERDRFLRGGPTGLFSDVTEAWATQNSPGRGLGIVAGRLDGQAQGVYIVNDASNNHFYRWNGDSDDPASDALSEAGVASGLAVDAQSLNQGSMGVASSDFDNDGDLDFYVTGFNREYNIYYDQQTPGFWSDQTARLGMVDSTLSTVGFGTEAIDFDNDGANEILVTNGHIGVFSAGSPPYAQPLQLFRASGHGRFQLSDMSGWDDYLRSPHVGRVLFPCDADQDGRTDVVVTHATEPVALLMNKSDTQYRRIAFRLADTRQSRDAVGAIVSFEIRAGPHTQRRFLYRLSGDGYLCSNRPELFAGTGPATVAHDVQVTWPDGEVQAIGDLDTNREYLIVRGRAPFRLREYASVD